MPSLNLNHCWHIFKKVHFRISSAKSWHFAQDSVYKKNADLIQYLRHFIYFHNVPLGWNGVKSCHLYSDTSCIILIQHYISEISNGLHTIKDTYGVNWNVVNVNEQPELCILIISALRWRHNGRDSVSNHQPHHCLLNRLFRRRSKHQSSASLAFVWGIHWGPVNSPHNWPVTRKMFPFDDVIMEVNSI